VLLRVYSVTWTNTSQSLRFTHAITLTCYAWYQNKQLLGGTCDLLGFCAAYSGYSVPTFRDNLSVPSSWHLKFGPVGCPATSLRNNHSTLRKVPLDCKSHLYHNGGLKLRIKQQLLSWTTLISWLSFSSSYFPLGSFSLCFRKHLRLMAYCTIPVLDFQLSPQVLRCHAP
jgi:hypothetical protein